VKKTVGWGGGSRACEVGSGGGGGDIVFRKINEKSMK
jgi:hypothetical protein